MTNKQLKETYDYFNRKYFSNKLKRDASVTFSRLKRPYIGVTRGRTLDIEISDRFKNAKALVYLTLLHEMVHAENIRLGHGAKFDARMLKLAKQGAFNKLW